MRKHWTQTPDGRARIREINRQRHHPERSRADDRDDLRAHDQPQSIAVQRQIVLSLKGRAITLEEQDAKVLNERLTSLLKDH